MPALDDCHPQVVRALEKEGWHVEARPFQMKIQKRRIYIDLEATRQINGSKHHILLVEVKCFTGLHPTTELYQAVGQYLIYRAALAERNLVIPLFLFIPLTAYQQLFDVTVQRVSSECRIKWMVVDLLNEEIVEWIG